MFTNFTTGANNLHLIFKERLTNFLVCVYYNIIFKCCQPLSGTAYRNRTHIQEVEALCIIHYTKAVWCERRDSNPYAFRRQILSLLCIPFHHSRINLVLPPRIEQGSSDFQSGAMTTSAKAALG